MTPASERLLRQYSKQLMRDDCFLRPLAKEQFGIYHAKNDKRALAKIDAVHIAAWQAADLITSERDVVRLSPTGKSWVRRAQAAHSPFMAQHQTRGKSKAKEAALADCNITQTPLEWLRARQKKSKAAGLAITAIEFDAGDKLRNDFERAQLNSKVGMDWSRPVFVDGGRGGGDVADHILDSRRRVQKALTFVGPGLADLLLSVCCCLQGLEDSEANYNLPRRSGKVLLKMALMRLSVFYGLQSEEAAADSFRKRN